MASPDLETMQGVCVFVYVVLQHQRQAELLSLSANGHDLCCSLLSMMYSADRCLDPDAHSLPLAGRRQALPNRGFWQQLNEYESQLIAASQDNAGGVRFGHTQADDSPQIISASRQPPLGDAKAASIGCSRGRTRGNAQERPEALQNEERSRDTRDSILGSGAVDYWK